MTVTEFPYTLQLAAGPRQILISTEFSSDGVRKASISTMVRDLRRAYDAGREAFRERLPELRDSVDVQWGIILAPPEMQAATREIIARISVYIDSAGASGSPTVDEIAEGMPHSGVSAFGFLILSRFNAQMRAEHSC